MSEGDGTVYNARQLSEALGVSTAMVRKYAAAYEAITGASIKQHARDGRLYTRDQLDALVTAKGFVESNAGMSVDTALRIALGRAETAVKEPQVQTTDIINTSAFAEAILAELRGLRLANERLLERLESLENRQLPSPEPTEQVAGESADERLSGGEMQALRDEVATLRSELAQVRVLPPGVTSERIDRALRVEMQTAPDDGVMVKAARWLERRLRRRGQR